MDLGQTHDPSHVLVRRNSYQGRVGSLMAVGGRGVETGSFENIRRVRFH